MKKIENKLPLLLTLFYACFGLFRFFAQGPFYLRQNGDVNYVYLLTGLDYWSLQPSSINDQPALTVKLVNALNIGIVYPIRSLFIDLTMEQDVLKNSEFYMSISALLIFAILLLVFYRFIKYSYNLIADKAIWMVSVIAIFSSHIVTDSLFVNKPEPYLIITGIGISYFLVQHHFHKRAPKPWKLVALVLFGILSKITIAPFFLVFILMFPNIRSLAKATSIGIGISATIVAIFFSEFKAFLAFILKTSSHSGMYGTGNVGFYSNLWQENLLSFLRINPILLVLLLAGLAHALFFRRNRKIVITLFASYVIFFVFILKNPYSHYFIPCYFILPAYLLISFEGIRLKKYKPFVFAICIVLLGYRTFTFHRNINIAYSNWKNLDHTPSIQAYHNSTKAYCLISSNISQGNTHSQVLTQLFPKDTVYLFDKTMHTASKQIDYTKIKGTYTISGSSEHIEQNKMLQIIRKRIVGEKIIYTVITKD